MVVIPARFASVRFPGKPLALIHGKPMIQHVWERCRVAAGVDHVIVATEDERIKKVCDAFGADCEITSPQHQSGTDRVAEVAKNHADFDIVLNVQGDEPTIASEAISAVVTELKHSQSVIATPVASARAEDVTNSNVVKVVTALNGNALYFSRSPIPCHRDGKPETAPGYLRHIGLYGFHRDTLFQVTKLTPSPLERSESLEQLRWLQSGFTIRCVPVSSFSVGIDTPEDLQFLEQSLLDHSR